MSVEQRTSKREKDNTDDVQSNQEVLCNQVTPHEVLALQDVAALGDMQGLEDAGVLKNPVVAVEVAYLFCEALEFGVTRQNVPDWGTI